MIFDDWRIIGNAEFFSLKWFLVYLDKISDSLDIVQRKE